MPKKAKGVKVCQICGWKDGHKKNCMWHPVRKKATILKIRAVSIIRFHGGEENPELAEIISKINKLECESLK